MMYYYTAGVADLARQAAAESREVGLLNFPQQTTAALQQRMKKPAPFLQSQTLIDRPLRGRSFQTLADTG